MAACDMIGALKSASNDCKLTMAGTADRVYFFDRDVWADKIKDAIDDAADNSDALYQAVEGLPEPGYMGYYGLKADGTEDKVAQAKLACLTEILYAVDIKSESGQVTSEKGADSEACSQKATFVVKDNMKAFNELAHTLAFKKWGCIVEGLGVTYMVMSPYKSCKFENNFDSGTTYDSDHGFTVNVDASPAEYGVTYLPDGTKISDTVTLPKMVFKPDPDNNGKTAVSIG